MTEQYKEWSDWDVYDFPNGKPEPEDTPKGFLDKFDRVTSLEEIQNMTEEELAKFIEGS